MSLARASTVSQLQLHHAYTLLKSFLDQGVLRVTLVEGKEIHGADRSGKSDPFVVFTLGEQKVYKSEVIKKTLAPQWKESFDVMIVGVLRGSLSRRV